MKELSLGVAPSEMLVLLFRIFVEAPLSESLFFLRVPPALLNTSRGAAKEEDSAGDGDGPLNEEEILPSLTNNTC